MKDRLIRLIQDNTNGYSRIDAPLLAEGILEDLRCDKCKHRGYVDEITASGTCEAAKNNAENYAVDFIWVRPDFFCAKWEPK